MTGKDNNTPGGGLVPLECAGLNAEELEAYHSEAIIPENILPLVDRQNMELFVAVADAFAMAERRMKIVEWIDGTDVPSINELRYVGYHLFRACQCPGDSHKQHEELKRAERHCKRACFDAMELGIIAQLEKISAFKRDYKRVVVTDVINDYLDLMAQAQVTRDFLASSDGVEGRDEHYLECETHLDKLIEINRRLEGGRDELNKHSNSLARAERRASISSMAAVAAAVVAAIALIMPKDDGNSLPIQSTGVGVIQPASASHEAQDKALEEKKGISDQKNK